jgi:hypothetical protein
MAYLRRSHFAAVIKITGERWKQLDWRFQVRAFSSQQRQNKASLQKSEPLINSIQ